MTFKVCNGPLVAFTTLYVIGWFATFGYIYNRATNSSREFDRDVADIKAAFTATMWPIYGPSKLSIKLWEPHVPKVDIQQVVDTGVVVSNLISRVEALEKRPYIEPGRQGGTLPADPTYIMPGQWTTNWVPGGCNVFVTNVPCRIEAP